LVQYRRHHMYHTGFICTSIPWVKLYIRSCVVAAVIYIRFFFLLT
jgi:hypothetical protein